MKDTKPSAICKRAVGLDVCKDSVEAETATKTIDDQRTYSGSRSFSNNARGFRQLMRWVKGRFAQPDHVWFVMEATGVYHEQLAYFLDAQGAKVSVQVATRISSYADSLAIKSKTDPIDAGILARFGLERPLQPWQPASPKLRAIKMLLRERVNLQDERTRLTNRLHAAQTAWNSPQGTLDRLADHIQYIDQQLTAIEEELNELWAADQRLADPIRRIEDVQGLKPLSILTVLAETNGFALRPNRNQVSSYSGLDVVLEESGTHKGASSISKHGNTHIRRVLYMPAVTASQHNPALRAFYQRLINKYGEDQKQKAIVAVMRKLLLLIHSLWKSGQEYDPEFHYQQITKAT